MRLRIVFLFLLTLTSGLALALLTRTAPAEQFAVGESSSAPVNDSSVGGGHPAPAVIAPVAAHSDAAGSADSASASPWTLAGQLGGNVTDVAWLGNYALLGFGPRVVVVDVTAPESPRWVATGPLLPDVVWGIAVAGDRAYVAAGDAGLFVLDAADPLDLQMLGSLALPARALDVQVAGDYAYMVVTDVGLRVVDVRDPARLVEVGALERSEGRHEDWSRLAVSGGMAVVVEQLGPVTIIDVRNPRQPRRVSIIESTAGDAMDVVVTGDLALVAHRSPRLTVFDLAKLEQLSTYDVTASGELWSLAADGTTAYLADDHGAVHMLDVSDPDNPRSLGQVGQLDEGQPVVTALAARSGMVLAPTLLHPGPVFPGGWPDQIWFGGGLRIVDATQPARPSVAATLSLPSGVMRDVDVAADGRSAWVINSGVGHDWDTNTPDFADNAAMLVDATDPARPRVRASLRLPGDAEPVALAVVGSYVYVLGMSLEAPSDVYVFDATNLDAPAFKLAVGVAGDSTTWAGGERYGIEMLAMGDRLVITDHDRSYWLDVSNPAAPQVLNWQGSWDAELAYNAGLAASGPYLYFGTAHTLGILDLRDPTTPRLAASLPIDTVRAVDETTGIAASGPTVLVVSTDNFLRVFDASSVANPREVGRVAVPASYYTVVAAHADRGFALGRLGDLTVLDITRPAAPAVRQTIATAAPADWEGFAGTPSAPVIAAAAGRVYASAWGLGLLVYAPFEGTARVYLPTVYRSHLLAAP